MRISVISLALAATLSLTACEGGWKINGVDTGVNSGNAVDNSIDYCKSENGRYVCIGGVLLVAGGVAMLVNNNRDSNWSGNQQPSDKRLKEDIMPVAKLDNGIQLYSFSYKGDPRHFIGVLAQDLLKDKRFSGAVTRGPDGYYRVDYSKLGLRVTNPLAMLEAGSAAAKL